MRLDKEVYESAHNLFLKFSCDAIKKIAYGSFFFNSHSCFKNPYYAKAS